MSVQKPTVFVCGHGRCGSSLMMQMLQAGGFPVFGDYPAFEPDEVGFSRDPETLLPLISGRAAKILDPQMTTWPDILNVKVIWLDRDRNNQALSQVKFMRWIGAQGIPDNAWKTLARSYGADTAAALRAFKDRGIRPLRVGFEMLITSAPMVTDHVQEYLGVPLDLAAMHAVVRDRDTHCQPDMSIEESLCLELL